jgi:hypothetical protein
MKQPSVDIEIDANGITPGPWPRRGAPRPEEVAICRDFLDRCDRTKTARVDSYGLKHIIERWAGDYVSNGACLQAAVDLGLLIKPYGRGSCNADLGISRRSVKATYRSGRTSPEPPA